MADALETVMRLRRVAVDDAKRELAAMLQSEGAAEAAAQAAEDLIDEEAAVAADLARGDDAVEAFAAWLPLGRANAAAARAAHEQLRSEVAKARAALTVARAAAEASENLLRRRAEQRALEEARRSQIVMDEIAASSVLRAAE